MIQFILMFSRQGKLTLQKWYDAVESKEKKIARDLTSAILLRKPKMCNFIEYKDLRVVYKRYASLFFWTREITSWGCWR
jgi:AP-1 complex subunit sigma 1/2